MHKIDRILRIVPVSYNINLYTVVNGQESFIINAFQLGDKERTIDIRKIFNLMLHCQSANLHIPSMVARYYASTYGNIAHGKTYVTADFDQLNQFGHIRFDKYRACTLHWLNIYA